MPCHAGARTINRRSFSKRMSADPRTPAASMHAAQGTMRRPLSIHTRDSLASLPMLCSSTQTASPLPAGRPVERGRARRRVSTVARYADATSVGGIFGRFAPPPTPLVPGLAWHLGECVRRSAGVLHITLVTKAGPLLPPVSLVPLVQHDARISAEGMPLP
jgi:hypothetical protein